MCIHGTPILQCAMFMASIYVYRKNIRLWQSLFICLRSHRITLSKIRQSSDDSTVRSPRCKVRFSSTLVSSSKLVVYMMRSENKNPATSLVRKLQNFRTRQDDVYDINTYGVSATLHHTKSENKI